MENWNDLKLVLAIHREEGLNGGARRLNIDHSTAFRRLNAFEAKIGARLFERLPGGVYLPTAAGEKVARTAERMETEADSLARDVIGQDARLTGSLRITSSETLAFRLLTPQLARFQIEHPGIAIELMIDNRILSLSRREADIALRVTRPKEPDLFGKKLGDIGWTVYGTPAQLETLRNGVELSQLPFVGWTEETIGVAAVDWLNKTVASGGVVYRANSMINQLCAAREGVGAAVLPCYLGDPEPGLVRLVPEPIAVLSRELWIVTHLDLRRTARIRAFFDIVGGGLSRQQAIFSGQEQNSVLRQMTADLPEDGSTV